MNFSLESLYSWYRSMIRNPQYRWWIVLGTLAYLWSPIDFLPDIFPIIGWIDDGLLATLLVSEISQLVLARLKLKTDEKQTAKPIVEVVSPD
ncbi:MAG: YkvA family protein [Snowella sp.]|nr:YkvA family protein [Snowella sp.]